MYVDVRECAWIGCGDGGDDVGVTYLYYVDSIENGLPL